MVEVLVFFPLCTGHADEMTCINTDDWGQKYVYKSKLNSSVCHTYVLHRERETEREACNNKRARERIRWTLILLIQLCHYHEEALVVFVPFLVYSFSLYVLTVTCHNRQTR